MRSAATTPLLGALLLSLVPAATWPQERVPSGAPAPAPATVAATTLDSTRYALAITDIHRVGVTITNYGFFGNSFSSRSPSFEFPLGSGYEHMSRAGLWVGGRAISDTGAFLGVSAAIVDNAQGSSGAAETEFTPAGTSIVQRSRIQNSRYFSSDAVSDQDLVCSYSDRPARPASGYQSERHTPIQILVKQTFLGFSLQVAQDITFARFKIVNLGSALRDVWVGLYAQLVSGDKNAYSTWPPSAGGSSQGSWYYKTYVEYDAARRLYKEHFCQTLPYPNDCNFGYAPPWAAIQLLGIDPGYVDSATVSFNWWNWSPGDGSRGTDVLRYALMSNGLVGDPSGCVPGTDCSPVMLLSVGPFDQIDTGDSIGVDFAFVGGNDETRLLANADYARFARDKNYVLPMAPPSPRDTVVARDGELEIYWDDSPESATDPTSPDTTDFEGYRVYVGEDRQNLQLVAQVDLAGDTASFNTGLEGVRRAPGDSLVDGVPGRFRYHKKVSGVRNGFKYYTAVTSFDMGTTEVEPLESGISQNKRMAVPGPGVGQRGERGRRVYVYPNPYRVEARWDQGRLVRDHYVWFTNLPERCRLKVYTLSGDLVHEVEFDGRGYHGENARGVFNPAQDADLRDLPTLSGTTYGWNLISSEGQAVATGLYLWAVEELGSGEGGGWSGASGTSGERMVGKLLIVKSDRERF